MEKLKTFLKKFKWYLIGGTVLLLGIILVITLFVKNHKINVEDDVQVSFHGYEKSGTAEITDKSYDKVMNKLYIRALKQSNFKNKEIIRMIENNEGEDIEEENLNYDELHQMRHASKIMDNVNFNIYNNENLSNGDKVKVQLKLEKGISKEFKLKAKEFTKEFKVHGLKKPKELSAKDLIEGFNPKFTGVNGSGSLNLITKDAPKNLSNLSLSNYEFTVPNNGNLKNGDSIKLTIPQDLIDDINNNGSSSFKGKKTYTIKANDLPELNKLENISETLDRNNKLIKNEYNSSKYTKYKTENIDNYYKVDYGVSSDDYFDNDKEESEKVSPVSKIEPTKITLITAVKVTRTSEYSDPDVNYNYKGYKNYNLENNRLVKDDTTEEVSTSSDEDSMNDLHDELTSDDYKKL